MKKTTKIISIIIALIVGLSMISSNVKAVENEEQANFIIFPKKLVNNEGTIERVHGILQDEREFTKEQVDQFELVYEVLGITEEEYESCLKGIELSEKTIVYLEELQDITDNWTISLDKLEESKRKRADEITEKLNELMAEYSSDINAVNDISAKFNSQNAKKIENNKIKVEYGSNYYAVFLRVWYKEPQTTDYKYWAIGSAIYSKDGRSVTTSVPVTGIRTNKTSATLKEGEEVILVPAISPEDAKNKNITWESDDPSVATVDQKWTVKAIKEGETTIRVTTEDGEYSAECKIIVVKNEEPDPDPGTNPSEDPDPDPGTNPSEDPDPDPGTNPSEEPDPDPGTNPSEEPDPNPGTNPSEDPDPNPGTNPNEDPDPDPETNSNENKKPETNNNNNKDQSKDKVIFLQEEDPTTAKKEIPQTGQNPTIVFVAIAGIGLACVCYIGMKKNSWK